MPEDMSAIVRVLIGVAGWRCSPSRKTQNGISFKALLALKNQTLRSHFQEPAQFAARGLTDLRISAETRTILSGVSDIRTTTGWGLVVFGGLRVGTDRRQGREGIYRGSIPNTASRGLSGVQSCPI